MALFRKSGLFRKKNRTLHGEMELQITSMADIFTILLVFLLKSTQTGATAITPSAGLELAQAARTSESVEALKIEVSQHGVSVEGRPVTDLQALNVSELEKSLGVEHRRQEAIARANPAVKTDGKVIIVADQRIPYGTLKKVLGAAARSGFTDFRLAVVQKE